MAGAKGLTLLEVILAIGLLAVVLLAFTGLQITSLRAGAQGRVTQGMVREAQNFLENLRANPGSISALCNPTKKIDITRQTAFCTSTPCRAETNGTLNCPVSEDQATAYRVRLQVPKDRPRLDLETVVYRP